ncbi:MAG: hypothetical protein OEZ58_00110 [Gammaproteobacteria bacterium]|nr:hypothetical protein [Gammaproteobacteria bacterium]
MPFYDDANSLNHKVVIGANTFDRWVIGEGADSTIEYLIHLSEPRFICKMFTEDFDDNEDHDILEGITMSCDGLVLNQFIWIDEPPTGDNLHLLMADACKALDRDSLK